MYSVYCESVSIRVSEMCEEDIKSGHLLIIRYVMFAVNMLDKV